jgi:transcriptional regulator with XRE-family HTH domain
MDETTTVLSSAIGARVKHERQALGWTLDRLATAASVSRRMVVNIEQGAANPSVGILLRISDALGIGLPALVEPPHAPAVRVTRHGEGAALWQGDSGGTGVLVAGTQPPDVLELWDWAIGPGERHDSEAHSTGTMEALQVQQGAIEVRVDDEVFVIDTGDAISFGGDVPHSYANQSAEQARFSLAVFEPRVGSGKRVGDH